MLAPVLGAVFARATAVYADGSRPHVNLKKLRPDVCHVLVIQLTKHSSMGPFSLCFALSELLNMTLPSDTRLPRGLDVRKELLDAGVVPVRTLPLLM